MTTVLRLLRLLQRRSAKDVARARPLLGIFHERVELTTEMASELAWSKRGEGGVARTESSSDISEHTLSRGYAPGMGIRLSLVELGRRERRVEKYLGRGLLGGTGGGVSDNSLLRGRSFDGVLVTGVFGSSEIARLRRWSCCWWTGLGVRGPGMEGNSCGELYSELPVPWPSPEVETSSLRCDCSDMVTSTLGGNAVLRRALAGGGVEGTVLTVGSLLGEPRPDSCCSSRAASAMRSARSVKPGDCGESTATRKSVTRWAREPEVLSLLSLLPDVTLRWTTARKEPPLAVLGVNEGSTKVGVGAVGVSSGRAGEIGDTGTSTARVMMGVTTRGGSVTMTASWVSRARD